MGKPIIQRKLDLAYAIYFVIHIVVTLLIDSTIAIPREYLFDIQKHLGDFHIASNKDLLVESRPIWLQSFVWVELLFQTPFFLIATYGLIKDCKKTYILILIYAVEAAITTFGCLAEVLYLDGLSPSERTNLFLLYLPTCIIPLAMGLDIAKRIASLIGTAAQAEKVKTN
ncbi:hypothetical protein TRVA0_035S00958 [Trichomonascus vanleenenianus]|uniref:Ema19p n=1 Tax=Trichomonascus vanleenenianus TaxID=2268995 RepID=UPI003ECA33A5